jgi:UDP-GlcNAc:undecaprenyl-phosphate/decaprenyl-phosphate GlcNAc-1-phosphate transferase
MIVFFVSLAVTLISVPLVRTLVVRFGVMDRPNDRKLHHSKTPSMGGISFYLALALGLLTFYICKPAFFSLPGLLDPHSLEPAQGLARLLMMFYCLMGSLAILALAGSIDDSIGLRPAIKLGAQLLAAGLLYGGGFRITSITWLDGGMIDLGIFSFPLTIVWLVGLTNAINFLDGMDGLAAGVVAIATGSLLVISLITGDDTAALLYAIVLASSLGFLVYNFHPASVFMGDCGSMFLGFTLAASAIIGSSKGTTFLALLLPLGLPIFDVFSAILRRKSSGTSMMKADRNHLHHRLLDMGMPYRTVVWLFYGISIVLGLSAIIAAQLDPRFTLILLFNFILATLLFSYALEFIESRAK